MNDSERNTHVSEVRDHKRVLHLPKSRLVVVESLEHVQMVDDVHLSVEQVREAAGVVLRAENSRMNIKRARTHFFRQQKRNVREIQVEAGFFSILAVLDGPPLDVRHFNVQLLAFLNKKHRIIDCKKNSLEHTQIRGSSRRNGDFPPVGRRFSLERRR